MQRMRHFLLLLAVAGFFSLDTSVHGQAATETTAQAVEAPGAVTAERVDQVQKAAEASAELSDADRTQIAELTQQALTDLKAAEAADLQAKDFETRAGDIETVRSDLEKKLAQPSEPVKIAADRTIGDLESEVVQTQALIAELDQTLKAPTVDPAARTARRKAARGLTTELPAKLAEIDQKLTTPAPEGEPPLLTEARKLALTTLKQATQSRLNAAQKELALYDAADAVNLPTLRREDATRSLVAAQKRLEALGAEVNRRRQAEAERRAQEAEMAAINAQPLLKAILEESQEIARTEQELRSQHEEDKRLLQQVENRFKEFESDAQEARRLDKDVGLEKMGIWLRQQRESLEDLTPLFEKLSKRLGNLEEAEFAFYERKDQLDDLTDIETAADELTSQAALDSDVDLETFHEDAIQVLRGQSVNLQKLVDEYAAYTETLATLNKLHQQLREKATEYVEFLDERILWVRSHLPLSLAVVRAEGASVARILSPTTWMAAAKSIAWDATDHLPLFGGVCVLLIYLMYRRRSHGQQLQEIAKRASGRVTTSMAPTIHCLIITIWLSVAWPGLILFLAWRLHESSISTPEMQVAALNLARLASIFFLLEFIRQSVRPYGLADAHFEWNTRTLRRVRRLFWSVMILGLPIAATVACLHQQDPASRRDGIERLLFIASMVVLAMFAHGLLSPTSGALRQLKALHDGGWFDRLDRVWHLLGVGVPLVLAAFAFMGYYDTAVRLALKVHQTGWLVVAAIYLNALVARWLMLHHRRLRIEKARERLAAAQEKAESTPDIGAPLPELHAAGTDLDAISEQSQRLLTTTILVACVIGLWFVWVDVLPALRFLDRWPIWETTTQTVELVENPETGDTETRPSYEIHRVTFASLVQVLLIVLLTSTAARNIPGLLEIVVLARLPIDRSTAYAITSLTRYALVLVGLILASRALGIGWAKVQWLAAALTFGLGFGLQEIFANFVSGLIILFEQPVRVGDVVTIDGVSGIVNRIRIRATTIVDWDRKEYIVPNREFITGRLLNWTLTDKLNRIVVNVGVAYGSNAGQVREIIMEVLEAHPNVLEDPPPLVTLESFGESSLDFVVRAYLPNLDNRLQTIHDLHTAIHDNLAAAGIVIPFPQRDLHLRTTVTLDQPKSSLSSNGHAETAAAHHHQHESQHSG